MFHPVDRMGYGSKTGGRECAHCPLLPSPPPRGTKNASVRATKLTTVLLMAHEKISDCHLFATLPSEQTLFA